MPFDWKRNLYVVWLAQFLSIMGFSFALPFAPYYIQTMGVSDPGEIKLWTAYFSAVAPLGMLLFSPVWGMLADRFGRKPMMLRAYISGACVLTLMGLARRPEHLIVLRLFQGVFTGTIAAAQALVATNAPTNRSGMALGFLSAAVYSGGMVGAFVGGWTAELVGYRVAFLLSGLLLLAATLLVWLGVGEDFKKPERRPLREGIRPGLASLSLALPLLVVFAAVSFSRQFDMAMFPLLVQEINGKLAGASAWAGSLQACGGVAGLLAGLCAGAMADRFKPSRLTCWMALGAGLCLIPQGLAAGFPTLFLARFPMVFCAGGLDPVFQAWLAKVTPERSRGLVFGWSASAKALGWIFAPLASGYIAYRFNVRSVFFVGALVYFLLIGLIFMTMSRRGGVKA